MRRRRAEMFVVEEGTECTLYIASGCDSFPSTVPFTPTLTRLTWKRVQGLMTLRVTNTVNKELANNPNFYLAGQVSHTVTYSYSINQGKKRGNQRVFVEGLNQPVGQGGGPVISSPYSCANVCEYMDCVSPVCVNMTMKYPSVSSTQLVFQTMHIFVLNLCKLLRNV